MHTLHNKFPNFDTLMFWIKERHSIYLKRKLHEPKPWTADPILQAYRFCNVYRELDKVTVWISKNWRTPNKNDPDLWFACLVARYINEPGTLTDIGYPVPWQPEVFLRAIQKRKLENKTIFNAAYIISTGGLTKPKHEYLADFFTSAWKRRKYLRPTNVSTLREYCDLLLSHPGIGRFMAGQVIADLKYAQMKHMPDWHSFAISGPGSRRGMNRLLGYPVNQSWRENEWFAEHTLLRKLVNENLPDFMKPLHGQDLQNCLCEFDKYMRAKLNEGKPKQRFKGV